MTLNNLPSAKRCPACGILKSSSQFNTATRKTGFYAGIPFLQSYCKPCNNYRKEQWILKRTKASQAFRNRRNKQIRKREEEFSKRCTEVIRVSKEECDKFKNDWCRETGMPQCLLTEKSIYTAVWSQKRKRSIDAKM